MLVTDSAGKERPAKVLLVTGGAGFIGSHTCQALLARGDNVVVVDDMNESYDSQQKRDNLRLLVDEYSKERVHVHEGDVCDESFMSQVFAAHKIERVVHLAARTGVRPSIQDPLACVRNNYEATVRLLELAKRHHVEHLSIASSSSVYGKSEKDSFGEADRADRPLSPYAATKKGTEDMAYVYHHNYGMSVSMLRFFTVYGPRGRPDMAPFKFLHGIMRGETIDQYGDGTSERDYTYVGDIVDGVVRSLDRPLGFQVFNLGNGQPISLKRFIEEAETQVGVKAKINVMPEQPGDVQRTCADIRKARSLLEYNPKTSLETGLKKTAAWIRKQDAREAGATTDSVARSVPDRPLAGRLLPPRVGIYSAKEEKKEQIAHGLPHEVLHGSPSVAKQSVRELFDLGATHGRVDTATSDSLGSSSGSVGGDKTESMSPLRVVAVVATVPSREPHFLERALESIASQTTAPTEVIVVTDFPPLDDDVFNGGGSIGGAQLARRRADAEAHAKKVQGSSAIHKLHITHQVQTKVLVNERSKNMSGTGCWNTAIYSVLETGPCEYKSSTCGTFVAILDDDDEWKPDHLKCCIAAVDEQRGPRKSRIDWVVSGIERREDETGDSASFELATPDTLRRPNFLRGNPGVQGSNLFVRLPLLLRAGCFDENLDSMTDRDLCLRMLELVDDPDASIAFTSSYTVIHHAEPESIRQRVTTSTRAKSDGAVKFRRKWRPWCTDDDLKHFKKRCFAKFKVDVDLSTLRPPFASEEERGIPTTAGDDIALQPASYHYLQGNAAPLCIGESTPADAKEDGAEQLHGLFGIISSSAERLRPLLRDIASLPRHIVPFVVVFSNTTTGEHLEEAELKKHFHPERAEGDLCLEVILPSTAAVTAIVREYYVAIRGSASSAEGPISAPHPIGMARTILQGHMRAMLEDAGSEFFECAFAMVLDDDKRLPRDSFLSSQYLGRLDQSKVYIGCDCKTAPNTLVNGLRVQLLDLRFSLKADEAGCSAEELSMTTCAHRPGDDYYDLSTSRYDHLEEPQLARIGDDLSKVQDRILRGDPLARDCLPPIRRQRARQRGGCMLLFRENFACLGFPQFVPEIQRGGNLPTLLSRRSDSIWLEEHRRRGVGFEILPALFVLHDNKYDRISSPTTIRSNALAETWGAVLCRDKKDRPRYLRMRMAAMAASNDRARGLTYLLRGLNEPKLDGLLNYVENIFEEDAWAAEVLKPLQGLLQDKSSIEWSPPQNRGDAARAVRAERLLRNAQVLKDTTMPLRFVGQGAEGIVFRTVGEAAPSRCYKVFWPDSTQSETILRGKIVDQFSPEVSEAVELLCTKNVLKCRKTTAPSVLSYKFVEGTLYRGGHGNELVALLRHLRELKIAMSNVKPANLVVERRPDSTLRINIVDLGHDWVPYTPRLFESMCRRAFLSWRFGGWCGTVQGEQRLNKLMSCERNGEYFPELTGFDRFFEVCESGPSPFMDERLEKSLYSSLETRGVESKSLAPAHAALVIKTCLMEFETLLFNVRRLVWTLRRSGTKFTEVVLSVDRTRRDKLLRQHTKVDEAAFDVTVTKIQDEGLVDRVVDFDGTDPRKAAFVRKLNKTYFGVSGSLATHSALGEPHAALFAALDQITDELVLQVDSDICLNMLANEDLVARAATIFDNDQLAVTTTALPIYSSSPTGVVAGVTPGVSHRMEIRFCFLHLPRIREKLLPLEIPKDETAEFTDGPTVLLRRGWYRVFDWNVQNRGLRSYRFLGDGGFFVHIPNKLKCNLHDHILLADRLASPDIVRNTVAPTPAVKAWAAQNGHVDALTTQEEEQEETQFLEFFKERAEDMVFVCYGRNLSYGRIMRCLESLAVQRGAEAIGVVVVDDASDRDPSLVFAQARRLFPGRVSCIYIGVRLGGLCAKNHVVKRVCVNPNSVIVTLDLDDMLFKQAQGSPSVIERARAVFWHKDGTQTKYMVALGGMVRDSKNKEYALTLDDPRFAPAAGNVWMHLRCFRKALFDAIHEENFCKDGKWIEHGTDWAFMVPVVEQAGPDRVFRFPHDCSLYYYEDAIHTREKKHAELDQTQAFLRARPRFGRHADDAQSTGPHRGPCCEMPISGHHPDSGSTCGFELLSFEPNPMDGTQCLVFVRGRHKLAGRTDVPVRIHSECFTGDVLGSLRCDCGNQLRHFCREMQRSECAVLVYVKGHEGRGNGIDIKLREYSLQDKYPEENHIDLLERAGGKSDARCYRDCAMILHNTLSIRSVVLYTNNSDKSRDVMNAFGGENVRLKRMQAQLCVHNLKYLQEKVVCLGHDKALTQGASGGQGEDSAIARFLRSINVSLTGGPTMSVLTKIVQGLLEQEPFHNLDLVLAGSKPGGGTDKGESTTSSSGVCFDRNVFLASVLKFVGFTEVRLIGAHTSFFWDQPENMLRRKRGLPMPLFNHICLIVGVPGAGDSCVEYLVDAGNGAPYFTPLRLPPIGAIDKPSRDRDGAAESTYHMHSGVEYRLRPTEGLTLAVEHRRQGRSGWKLNYSFRRDSGLLQEDIRAITLAHASDPHFGHMLHSLRLNRWSLVGNSIVLRNTELRIVRADGSEVLRSDIVTGQQLASIVHQHFRIEFLSKLDNAAPTLCDYISLMNQKLGVLATNKLQALLRDYTIWRKQRCDQAQATVAGRTASQTTVKATRTTVLSLAFVAAVVAFMARRAT